MKPKIFRHGLGFFGSILQHNLYLAVGTSRVLKVHENYELVPVHVHSQKYELVPRSVHFTEENVN